ncbi:MAG: helix-turn-helix transcriptional regulator [Bacteroidota bacterium]
MAVLRIKEIMVQKSVSRLDLANTVGVTETTISNICTEKFYPKVELLLKLSEALDVDVRELFVPTRGNIITQSEVSEAREMISKGLKILNGK